MPDRSVVYSFIGRFDSLNAGLTTAGRNVQTLGTKMTALDRDGARMRAGLTQLGGTAGRVGLLAAGGLAAATKAAVDWESQWAGVAKTVDGTAAQMAALEGELRNLARTMPATHEEIAATAEAAGQLGVAREDITSFTRTMLMLGETTNVSADEAATSIAQFMNVLGTSGDMVDEIGNTLVALGNKGASTESQILAMAQRLSGMGTTVGATESDILGLASAMANLGIEADLGGGAVQRVMIGINTQVLSSGEKLNDFAALAGMSAEQFAQAWQESPIEAFDALLRGLGGVSASGGDVASVLADLGIKGTQNLQVMLRLAGAGDELTNSLDQSGEAWEENSALTEEFARRAETTAAEVQVAWNNVKDAGIELGAATLPILSRLAGAAGDVASEFGKLPGPAKNAATGMLGITAVLGGGLWFTSKVVGGIANTRQALNDLGWTADRTGGSLGRMSRTAGKIAGLAGAISILGDALANATGAKLDMSDLQRDIEALANGGADEVLQRIAGDFDRLGYFANKATEPLYELTTGFGILGNTPNDNAADNIAAVDEALAGLVESGNAELASDAFTRIAAAITGMPESTSFNPAWIDGFDSYARALENTASASEDAADAQSDLGPAGKTAAGGLSQSAKAAEKAAERLKEAKGAARETAKGFITLGDSLNDGKKSLGEWMSELEQQAEALRNFTKNAQTAARRGLNEGLIKSLNEAGPAGALRMKQLANATDEEIKRANKAWREGQAAIRDYVNMKVPEKTLKVDNSQALSAVAFLQARIDSLRSKTIAIDIATGQRRAGGGPIYGPGTKTSDSVPVMASRGEFMMSAAAVDHYGLDTMFKMNARRLAAGGAVGQSWSGGSGGGSTRPLDDRLEIVGLLQSIRDLRRDLDARIKKGKNKGELEIQGLDRKRALLELEAAERDLRRAKNAEDREAREKAREQRKESRELAREQRETRDELRAGMGDLFRSVFPAEELTTAQQVAGTIREFRAEWLAAGGVWTKEMRDWAKGARAAAQEYDRVSTAIDTESARRDELTRTLSEQQSAYNELTSTMKSFGDSIAANFLTNPFGRTISLDGAASSPAIAAAQAALAAAQAAGDAAQASRLMQQIALMQEREPKELTGVAALRETLARDTQNSRDFAAALQALAGKGLDTTGAFGGLYAGLAQSGDLLTAQQMAELTAQEIDELEKAFKARDDAAATTAAQVVQEKYGADQVAMQAALAQTQAAIDQSTASIELMKASLPLIAEEVSASVATSVSAAADKVDLGQSAMKTAIDRVPAATARELQRVIRQGGK